MTLTWYGQSCFKVDTREVTLAIDPFSKDIGLTPPRFRADLVLVTHQHPDHANAAAIAGNPAVIAGPGEYEVKGIAIRGIPTFHDSRGGRERGPNTAFRIEAEGIALVHLGDFGESELREETAEALGNVDVLLVPVGGTYTVDGETAARLVHRVEPKIAIPMHYRLPGIRVKLEPAEDFLRAMGARTVTPVEKISLKRRDLPEKQTQIVVLAAG
ncbi:MAG: hypothetical protein A3B37_01515 [Candidatus Sungbacteria bacterium RIFCSPLOWO2_01_FULL_59_16]|uniref:Lactamase n=1 Tax=Candidatus Sungbacteria bacterium RIFCSPLOWO2_01_FULL_59_16 TaxID=1802280 RepID=A0A1G2LC76_9BACT|nr:MAG: hypothetical protein A3B37_01515 [Candidatus Sungbacteria bacterium RIFCSPLOWO2_01_FULL_59_16]